MMWDGNLESYVIQKNVDKVKCKLCVKDINGGIYRMKEHIAHVKENVSACPVSPKADQEKCKQAILDAKKGLKRKHEQELRAEVNINRDSNVEELEKELETLKSPHFQVPIDHYATSINHEASLAAQKQYQNMPYLWRRHMLSVNTVLDGSLGQFALVGCLQVSINLENHDYNDPYFDIKLFLM
ncbi:hypothetical protein Bca4012_010232 [Brassica carinata]